MKLAETEANFAKVESKSAKLHEEEKSRRLKVEAELEASGLEVSALRRVGLLSLDQY